MARTISARLPAGILALALASSAATSLAAMPVECGKALAAGEGVVPLASMGIQVPLFLLEARGRLARMDLRTGARTTLADHGLPYAPVLKASSDGRWLSYEGTPAGLNKTQYWLYDRKNQRELLIHEHPPFGSDIPSFSPDSRYLVMSAWYDSRWPDASRAGIYLFDTSTLRLRRVPLPLVDTKKAIGISSYWSEDGKALLIAVSTARTVDGSAYFSYDLATGRMETVAGGYDKNAYRYEFSRGAQRIAQFNNSLPYSARAGRSAWSPKRRWHARIDEGTQHADYHLLVTDARGAARAIATGRHEQCAGATLFISGWLDDRHLVYRNGLNYFVFDALAGTTAELFGVKDMINTFTW